ncbi:hypothetical protein [Actinoplanes siamensis]|uniref:Uncharacterized protein n=1 Tax=Actinoplanes siamensis TaxID=1223317 RepID=A0A919NC03_9ACTN|nr:hypothetical protein [Actinoplanes siamensis]GIF07979.1 hypothetical protein Asi03nite_55170 [Actinoplanes siamensis]
MIDRSEFDDITVTVAHPWGDLETPLTEWAANGPGRDRPFIPIVAATRRSTGERVSLDEIPAEYHNTRATRQMQREGLLPSPWGPPPEERQRRPLSPNLPQHVREAIERDRQQG